MRESTLMFKVSDDLTHQRIQEIIEAGWVEELTMTAITYWQDKDHVFCEFLNKSTKNEFLLGIEDNTTLGVLRGQFKSPFPDGNHFQRKPVKLEIPLVKGNIHAKKVNELIKPLRDTKIMISDVREGKPHQVT